LELTEEGRIASGDDSNPKARLAARLELAIARIEPFNALYEQFRENRIPAPAVMRDFAIDNGVAEPTAEECVETFLANARDLGLARSYAGAERLLTFEMLLDEVDEQEGGRNLDQDSADEDAPSLPRTEVQWHVPISPARVLAESTDLSNVCFFISPIGSDDSPERKHADLVLGSLVEPALEALNLRLVRADKISKPGLITAQVVDHIVRAPLVVADLSFGNPNVFYELALRHASRRPVIQIIRSADRLPFDVGQFRTVTIDMTDIFSLVPRIDSYRAEIARQCRAALDESGPVDSPLSLFYPNFWDQFGSD
jgi:hypothetical protein